MKTFIAAATLGATLLAGGSATAQGPQRPRGMDRALLADANQDGVVTRAEMLAAVDKMFARRDKNNDGQISKDEAAGPGDGMRGRFAKRWMKRHGYGGDMPPPGGPDMPPPPPGAEGAPPPPPGGPHEMHGRFAARMLERVDTNRDGMVSLAEERAVAGQRFDMVDTNRDGKIDQAEREAARERIRELRAALGPMDGPPPHPRGMGMMPPPPPSTAAPAAPTGE